jgi:putative endopeptidase
MLKLYWNAINLVYHTSLFTVYVKTTSGYWHLAIQVDSDRVILLCRWHMMPVMTNAYYSQAYNQIVFPAAILQRPFFTPTFPM